MPPPLVVTAAATAAAPSPTLDVVKPKKTRAKHACRECHARRVRCNVTDRQPCANCAASGAACEIPPQVAQAGTGTAARRRKHLV
ncbi:hypothetical protein E4U41_006891, partial [Claviceps citrina]